MTEDVSAATSVVGALKDGLAAAAQDGAKSVQASHLTPEQLDALATATLAHLRSRPGKPSSIEGWTLVTAQAAGVLSWWVEIADLSDAERRRLGPLRHEVYDVLAERHLIETDPNRNTSVHVSPVAVPAATGVALAPEPVVEPTGAWILKLSPYVYDVDTVFAAPDGRVRLWSVEQGARAASMQYGQPVYLWVDEGDASREAGVWGVGWVAGPCIAGVADGAWLDHEAASRATVFAVVEIALLEKPVGRDAFLDDERLVDAEVIRDPMAPNPGILSPSEAGALAEHLTYTREAARAQVA